MATVAAAPLIPPPPAPPARIAPPPPPPPPPAGGEAAKPGYLTTEFWTTALSIIGCFGVTFFHWSPDQNDQWSQTISRLAPFMAMVVSFLLSNQYCTKRNQLKQTLAGLNAGPDLKTLLAEVARTDGGVIPQAAKGSNGGASGTVATVGGTMLTIKDGRIVEIR